MALRFPISFSLAIKRSFYCSNSCFSSTLQQQQSVVCSSICSLSSIQDIQIMWNWWWHLHSVLKFEKKNTTNNMNALIKKTAFTQIIKYKSYVYRFQEVQVFYYFSCLEILSYFHKISLFQGYNIFFFCLARHHSFPKFFFVCFILSCFSIQRFKKNRVTHKCKSLSLEFTPLTVHKIRNSWKYSFFCL